MLDESLLAGNYAVNGGAFFAGTMPCFMVRLMLPTGAITFSMTGLTRIRRCWSQFPDCAIILHGLS